MLEIPDRFWPITKTASLVKKKCVWNGVMKFVIDTPLNNENLTSPNLSRFVLINNALVASTNLSVDDSDKYYHLR